MKLVETFRLISEQMVKELEFIKLGPDEPKGRSREIVLHRFLRPIIPIDMGACNGVVISTSGQSGEIDLIIHDRKGFSLFRPFVEHYPENLKPVPVETVYAVIEVENYLDKNNASKCVEKIRGLRELPKVAYYGQGGAIVQTVKLYGKEWEHFPTLGIVFAFDGNPNETVEVLGQADCPLEHGIDLVCLLQKGLITYYDSRNDLLVFPPEPNLELVYRRGSPEENLKILYLMLTRIFSQAWTRSVRVMDYFKA